MQPAGGGKTPSGDGSTAGAAEHQHLASSTAFQELRSELVMSPLNT